MQIFTLIGRSFTTGRMVLLYSIFFPMALLTSELNAQQRFTLSGYLRDENSGEALMYANIYPETLKTVVTTNEYGFFSVTLPEGEYSFVFSYIGYQTIKRKYFLIKMSMPIFHLRCVRLN